ncbi:MAG: vanadium nitrogenase [Roseburia sp.]
MTLIGWFLQYFIIFVILVLIAVAGFFVGKKLRENKDAKAAAMNSSEVKNED